MKPDIKSINFKLSLFSLALFVEHLFLLQAQVKNNLLNNPSGEGLPSIYFYLPYIWIGLAGLLFFKATKKKQSLQNQILAFVLTPIVLSPILGIVYGVIVLLPLYGLAGQSVIR